MAAVRNVSVACYRTSADFIISPPLMGEECAGLVPDYRDHLERA